MPRFRIILIPAIRQPRLDGDRSGLPTPSVYSFERCDIAPALSGVEPSSLQSRTALHTSGDRRHGQVSTENWLRRMESNHRKLVYETSVNTNSLRLKLPGDIYTASRRDTVSTRDGNRTRVSALAGRRTYRCATPAYISRAATAQNFFMHPI